MRRAFLAALLIIVTAIGAVDVGPIPSVGAASLAAVRSSSVDVLHGRVVGGRLGDEVVLWQSEATRARRVAVSRLSPGGRFSFTVERGLYYITADGLTTVVSARTWVEVSALTSVATAWAMAQFTNRLGAIYGAQPGLSNAALNVINLVTPSGRTAPILSDEANAATTTRSTLGSLANAMHACLPRCAALQAATGTRAPVAAFAAVARAPQTYVDQVWNLAMRGGSYSPTLGSKPAAWILSVIHTAGGFDGPGRMAFDSRGNIWVSNNFKPPTASDAGGGVIALDPAGRPRLHSPIRGGGVLGAWWGIAIDQKDNLWISSFVGGDTNPIFFSPLFTGGYTVSEFSSTGRALSPATGFTQGPLGAPQGIAVDQHGNVWIANHGPSTVVEYVGGDPGRARVYSGGGISKPFAVQVDADGNVWVTNNALTTLPGSLSKISPDGKVTGPYGTLLESPQGFAIDDQGYAWVTQFAGVGVDRIDLAKPGALPTAYGAPVVGTWGAAVDGLGNVWFTSFLQSTVNELCGTPAHCAAGKRSGDLLSPRGAGYTNGGLEHLTSIEVDQSGNLWTANNWVKIAPFTGGNGLVEFIGIASPVRTPLIGPPRKP